MSTSTPNTTKARHQEHAASTRSAMIQGRPRLRTVPPKERSSRGRLRTQDPRYFEPLSLRTGPRDLVVHRGCVPSDLDENLTDDQLVAAAALLCRYREATAGLALASGKECVCHSDISPVNTVLVDDRLLIDFDMAKPGPRMRDISYGAFLWRNLGWDGRPPEDQRAWLRLWSDTYGLQSSDGLIEEIEQRIRETVLRRQRDGAHSAARWWQRQLGWLDLHERRITP